MFEKEIKFISDFTINKINYLGSFFTYDELFNSDINPAILKFVSAEVDYKMYKDRVKLLNQSSFNYSGSEINKYFNLIGKEIKKSTKITYHDIKDIINQAVAFNIDYTIIPNESLMNLLFDSKEDIKAEDFKLKLNYIYYYPHIKNILISYIDKKKISILTFPNVKKILSEINNQVVSEAPEDSIEYAIDTISDFYNIGNTGSKKLSVNLVEIYLEKNNLGKYTNRLSKKVRDLKQKYDVEEIKSLLFSSSPNIEIEKSPAEEPAAKEESVQASDSPEETIEGEKNIEDLKAEASAQPGLPDLEDSDQKEVEFDITEHENLEQLYNFTEEEPEKKAPVNDDETIIIEKEKIQNELKISDDFKEKEAENSPVINKGDDRSFDQNEIVISNDKLSSVEDNIFQKKDLSKKIRNKDIFSYLSDKEIEKIVGNVFNDDRDDFASTMEKISESESYEDATEILKSVFKSYNINPYSKDAITFTNSVSNYFEQS